MKTAVDLADALLIRAKRLAVRRNTTLKQILEDALREELQRDARRSEPPSLVTHAVRGRGLQRGLSWDDWQALRGLAYQGHGAWPRIHDARIVALCSQHAIAELWTADRDLSRFAGVPARNPLP